MIDKTVVDRLQILAQEIKEIAPELNGQVIFNCARQMPKPKVTIMAADVTEVKK